MTKTLTFSINNIDTIIQSSEIVRTSSQKKLISPAVKTVAYKLTEKERNKIKKINNSLKNNYVLTYILLTYKRRKTEYMSVLRELRNKIPLSFTQFTILLENESRPRKRRRIASDTNNSENKDFDNSNFIQNYIKFRFSHLSNFSGKDEKEWKI
jgi:uncharacterized membrane protein